ncbi:MAG: DUF3352 domain-containing protein [Solirubrobacteraceae bacterium]
MTRRRLEIILVAAVIAAVALALVLRGPAPPADRADTFVPADAVVYVHLSTDPGRDLDAELLARLGRFPAFAALRARAQRAAGAPGTFDLKRDVRSWLGSEAAFAATARGTMAVLAVADEARAQGVLRRVAGARPGVRHAGVVVRRFGPNAAAFVGGFLVVAPEALVNQAIDLQQGRGQPLSRLPAYARAAALRPDDRALDAWAASGAAYLLLPPRLAGVFSGRPVSASVVPTDAGLRVTVRRLGGASANAAFAPALVNHVSQNALAYVGLRGLRALGPLLPTVVGDAATGLQGGLDPLLAALDGESALSIAPATPEPIVTLQARTSDPEAARVALADLQGVISALLAGSEDATGQVPAFEDRHLDKGLDGFVLTLAGGGELVYAVTDGRVIVSNADAGVRDAAAGSGSVRDAKNFVATVSGVPESALAIGFLQASKLLALADEAGLGASPTYRAARPDLRKIRALGAVVRRRGTDTTLELNLLIP